MNLTYYINKSDRRYLNKNITQISLAGHSNPVAVEILEDTSIITPTLKVKDVDVYMTANYCYLDDLRRYYYIEDITLSKGFAYLKCTIDVLMTYRSDLAKRAPLVRRSENKYNLYQIDDEMKLLNYKALKRIEFPSGFNADKQEFMLCVIGNTSGGE